MTKEEWTARYKELESNVKDHEKLCEHWGVWGLPTFATGDWLMCPHCRHWVNVEDLKP